MIKYWIVGVLREDSSLDLNAYLDKPYTTIHSVAWSGPLTREFHPFLPVTVEGEIKYTALENMELNPYGYTTLRHAREAIGRILGKGEGFVQMRNVSGLKAVPVNYTRMGVFRLPEGFPEVQVRGPQRVLPHGGGGDL